MTYTVRFDENLEIVYVIYSGEVSLDERMQAVKEVCTTYAEFMPLKILVDVRDLVIQMSFREQRSFGEFLSVYSGLMNARVAVLHKPSHNPNVLIDTIAFNNGYKLAEFNETADAEGWLTNS
jgi:hypothetical protein